MPATQIVLLVLVGGGLALFAISNLTPVLPLVFLGAQTISLPLAAWVGLALAAGAITSFFLQSLNYLHTGSSTRSREETEQIPRPRATFRREPQPTSEPEPESRTFYTPPPPPPEPPSSRPVSDWEERGNENWDFEEESTASRSSPEESGGNWREGEDEGERSPSRNSPIDYETPQEPKTRSQSGSIYSYSYREGKKKESGVGQSDVVYDANYRVITPPYQPPPPQPEPSHDEDDWGFEDDEDFNEEVEKNSPRG